MRTIIFYIIFFLFVPLLSLSSTPEEINYYFVNAAKIARPSVVNISIFKQKKNKEKTKYIKVADASGTILSGTGDIVTNHHVVRKGDFYEITDAFGKVYEAEKFHKGKYYLADEKTDIAILRILNRERVLFVPIAMANSRRLSIGEWVIAIGNPYGLKQSITGGIISSKGRDNIGFADIEDFIQSDVSINPGNSGGPLVNLYGKMVGLNTAIRTVSGGYQGISFAIPSNIVRQVYNELTLYGRVRRGWLGFVAREKHLGRRGEKIVVEVISVTRNSPAFLAGLQRGDIVRSVNKRKITSLGSLVKYVGNRKVGSRILVTASRNGKLYDFRFSLRERHKFKKIQKGLANLFRQYGIEIDENADRDIIAVSYVSPRSIVYGLRSGDIVISLNGIKTGTVDDFVNVYSHSGMDIEKLTIQRNNRLFIIDFKKETD
jgi:serine protease Do